jgi:uncharacterized membrane protein YbaN (DUF454 family)
MSFHPPGVTVEIVGTESHDQGRSCSNHDVCGTCLAENDVVRFRQVQVVIHGKEESAIAVYLVSDGIDTCRVGFLQRHLVKHWKLYDSLLAQVIEDYSKDSASPTRSKFHHNKGCCITSVVVVTFMSFFVNIRSASFCWTNVVVVTFMSFFGVHIFVTVSSGKVDMMAAMQQPL